MQLLVVIVNYRVAPLVVDCLRSLESEVRALPGTRVVVVENASGDGSAGVIREAIGGNGWGAWVELLESPDNLGFSGGNNLALSAARPSPDFALLLNPDTRVLPGALPALLGLMHAHPEVGIAGSRLLGPRGEAQGTPFRFPGIATELDRGFQFGPVSALLRRWRICPPKPEVPAPVDWVAGASMLLRWRMVEQIGLLDEAYFAYFEDTDYCLRAARQGWPTWYCPTSRVVHLEGSSSGLVSGRPSPRPAYWFEARKRYFVKNHGVLYATATDAASLTALAVGNLLRRLRGRPPTEAPGFFAESLRHSVIRSGFGDDSLRTRAAQAALWTTLGFGLGQLLRLVGNLVAARLLVPELFGLMALANVAILGLVLCTDLGVGPCLVRQPREQRGFSDTAWTLLVVRGLLIALLAVAIAGPLALLYEEPRLWWLIPLLGAGQIAAGLSSTALFSLSRRLQAHRLVKLELVSQGLGVAAMVAWAWVQPTVWALVVGALLPPLVKMLWSHALGEPNRLAWEPGAVRELMGFGRWVLASSALTFLAAQADRLILGKLLTLASLGVYGIALLLSEMPRALLAALSGGVLYPAFARLVQLPRARLRDKVLRARRPLLAGAGMILLVLVCAGDLLVAWLYDPRYAEARWMLPLLALGLWPAALYTSLEPVLPAIGKPVYQSYANGAKLLFSVVAIPVGYTLGGIFGAVAAVALNDLPHYAAISAALRRERLGSLRQDALASALFAALMAALLTARWSAGLGLPWDSHG